MQQITVTFDRIFDVVGDKPLDRGRLFFSFEAAGLTEYGVPIAGKPPLHDGMTVTAILAEPGNWQSLMCWKDHDTGQIAFGGRQPLFARIAVLAPICFVGAAMLVTFVRQPPWLAAGAAALLLAYVAGEVLAIQRLVRARSLLMKAGA